MHAEKDWQHDLSGVCTVSFVLWWLRRECLLFFYLPITGGQAHAELLTKLLGRNGMSQLASQLMSVLDRSSVRQATYRIARAAHGIRLSEILYAIPHSSAGRDGKESGLCMATSYSDLGRLRKVTLSGWMATMF